MIKQLWGKGLKPGWRSPSINWAIATPLLLLTPTLLLSGSLFLGPLLQSLMTSFRDNAGTWSWENYDYFFNSTGYQKDLGFTLAIGLGTVATCTLISLPLALLLRQPFRGRQLLWLLLLFPLVTPHIIAAYALRLTLSPASPFLFWLPQGGSGGIALVNAWSGLLIATTWKFFPVMLLNLSAALQGLPTSYEEAAQDLGVGRWQRLQSILLPLIAPGWLAGATLVFVLTVSQFTITLIIYGGQRLTTIPLDVYFETFSSRRPGIAAALGIMLMLITLLLVTVTAAWVRRQTRQWAIAGLSGLGERSPTSLQPSNPIVAGLLIFGILVFVLAPVVCLVLNSVSDQWLGGTPFPSRFTLHWYDYLFRYENGLSALGESTIIAIATAILTTIIAVLAAYALARHPVWGRELLEGFFLAKIATPVIVIAVGTATLFYRWQLNDTLIGIVLAHSVGALPLTVRSATAALERTDLAQEESAQDLGAGSLCRFWYIVLPPALSGIAGGAALAFLYSMDEFTVTFLISGVNHTTLPLRLYSALVQGYIEPAAAAAVILLIPSSFYLLLLVQLLGIEQLAGEMSTG
jgi:ABC-type spermidine/putrescine transport system permease subunit II